MNFKNNFKNNTNKNKPYKQNLIISDGELLIKILGGVAQESIGRNCMSILNEHDEMILIDLGIMFGPSDGGYSFLLPDMKYIIANIHKLKGILCTHTHEDHVGALKYFYKYTDYKYFPPIYTSNFSANYMLIGLQEHFSNEIFEKIKQSFVIVEDAVEFSIGNFKVLPISTIHSAPFALMFKVTTIKRKYAILHTGDFRMDLLIDNEAFITNQGYTNFHALATLGKENSINCMFNDSTRCFEYGMGTSEKTVMNTLDSLFEKHKNQRIIFTCFGTTTSRVLNTIKLAYTKHKRKIVLLGYSMKKAMKAAEISSMLTKEHAALISPSSIPNLDNNLLVMTAGSQGDVGSALEQVVSGVHPYLQLNENDVLIFSATIIPGSEQKVNNLVEKCLEQKITLYHQVLDPQYKLHGTGHAYKDDTITLMNLVKPKNVIPIHGNPIQLYQNNQNALAYGLADENTFLVKNGYEILISDKIKVDPISNKADDIYLDNNGSEIKVSDIERKQEILLNGLIIFNLKINDGNNGVTINRIQNFYTSELFQHINVDEFQKHLNVKLLDNHNDINIFMLQKSIKYVFQKYLGCARFSYPDIKILVQKPKKK